MLHLAGVLRDGMLKEMKWHEGFGAVMRAKVGGLRGLKQAAGPEAEMVLFSSVTALIGNVGQANYGAGNGFLDGFAEGREGSVAINWGAWEVGMYAKLDARLKTMGKGLEESEAGELLESVKAAGRGRAWE